MRDVVDGVRVVGMHIKYATIEPNALTLNNKRRRCVVLSVNTKKKNNASSQFMTVPCRMVMEIILVWR